VTDTEVHLIELKLVAGEANAYKADLRSVWAEPIQAVHAVDGEYNLVSNYYVMRTPVEDVLALVE
jgi:hypothetical protein